MAAGKRLTILSNQLNTLKLETLQKQRSLSDLRQTMKSGGLDGLEAAHKIEITYTSNAIEGNTLSASETALVLEHGITIAGKPLKDHLEAIDHAHALDWVFEIAQGDQTPITELDIRNLYKLIMARSSPEIAGCYANRARFVNTDTGLLQFPEPLEIPALMRNFTQWLSTLNHTPDDAFEAHQRLVSLHPFNDGNGRTARLLMNLVLLRGGYPAIAIRPADRPAYIAALETGRTDNNYQEIYTLLYKRLDETLNVYISAIKTSNDTSKQPI